MAMSDAQARDAVNGAALVVAGLYFYRRLTEPSLQAGKAKAAQPKSLQGAAGQVVGAGPLPGVGRFIIGWGVVFIVLSLLEGFAPAVAGSFALLVGLAAILINGRQVAHDIGEQLSKRKA